MTEFRTFSVSVTDLAAFCCRVGDLSTGPGGFANISMDQGQEGQKILQQDRPTDYVKEKSVTAEFTQANCQWVLRGRIDGIYAASVPPIIEEIKTIGFDKKSLPDSVHQLHLAQVKLYAALMLQEVLDQPELIVRVSYYHYQQQQTFYFDYSLHRDDLKHFLSHCVDEYGRWLENYAHYLGQRDLQLTQLEFPFSSTRQGQRQLSVQAYRDIRDGKQALYHAPTGLGKTIGLLFPGLKSLAEGHINQLWYLTAKGSGLKSVEQALNLLAQQTLQLRVCVLKAREKQCPCEPDQCPCRAGYYERLATARQDFQAATYFTEADLLTLAQQHQLCPHQLSRDLIPWADLIVADYNYVFDPTTSLTEQLRQGKITLLVDEAHNLPDRARQMYSARLNKSSLHAIQRQIDKSALKQRLKKLLIQFRSILQSQNDTEVSDTFSKQLDGVSSELIEWFAEQQWLLFPNELFDQLMQLMRFGQRLHHLENEDSLYLDPQQEYMEILCLDPAPRLHQISKQLHSAHYFSGSLLPLPFFRRALSPLPFQSELVLPSPFPRENQLTVIYPLNTRYGQRQHSLEQLCQIIAEAYASEPGRYLITLPSYDYLDQVHRELKRLELLWDSDLVICCQPRSATEALREQFATQMQHPRVLACVIAGGLFAEGLDFSRETLKGVIIVGTCLAPPNPHGDRIQNYYQEQMLNGFDLAYRFPAMNRVIQSAGRVIRSEHHRGLVLLLDDRFSQSQYQSMMPEHWQPKVVRSVPQLQQVLEVFSSDNV